MSVSIASRILHGLSACRRPIAIAGIVAVAAGLCVGCAQTRLSSVKVAGPTGEEIRALSDEIKQAVKELEYSDQVAEDFTRMVVGWKDKKGQPALALWKKQLLEVGSEYADGKINENELARFQESAIRTVSQRIRREIHADANCFELTDVTKHRKAQCLGYSQLLYVVANSIGLSATPIFVQELWSGVRLGVTVLEQLHVASIVNLANGEAVMVELAVRNGSVSSPFIMEKEYERIESYWQLKNRANPLRIHRRIRISDRRGLVAGRHINRGSKYGELGQHAQAIFEYDRAIRRDPESRGAYYNRANAYADLGQYAEALRDYSQAVELDPDCVAAYINRGGIYRKLKQYNDSIADYDRAITLSPHDARAYVNRAGVYIDLDDPQKAVSDCNTAIGLDSRLGEAYAQRAIAHAELGRHGKGVEDLRHAVAWKPALAETVRSVRDSYALPLSDKDIAEASGGFVILRLDENGNVHVEVAGGSRITGISPDGGILYERSSARNVSARSDRGRSLSRRTTEQDLGEAAKCLERGNSYYQSQQYNKAISEYDKAIELNPQSAEAYFNRAVPHVKVGKLQEAVNDLSKAIVLNPSLRKKAKKVFDDYLARPMGLSITLRMGRDGAVENVELATKTGRLTAELKALIAQEITGKSLALAGSEQSGGSKPPPRKGTTAGEDDAVRCVERGNAHYRLRQYDDAIFEYRKAIELDSDYAMAYYNRGNAYAAIRRFEQAKSDFLRTVELDPSLRLNVKKSSDTYGLNLTVD